MQLQAKTWAKEQITLSCDPSQQIRMAKKQLVDMLGLHPSDDLILPCRGIQHQTTSKGQSIQQSYIFYLVIKRRGSLYFNSLQNKTKLQFSSSAPSYRTVTPGLNLAAKCVTPGCKAYQQAVWVQKGFDNFTIRKEMFCCQCPECHQTTGQAYNMGYYKTKIRIQGKKDYEEKFFKIEEIVTDNKLTTFKQSDDEMRKWKFLQVKTQPL